MEETNPTSDPTNPKHLALLTRLSQTRPTTQTHSKPESETLSTFLLHFSSTKQSIQSDLSNLLSQNSQPVPASIKSELEKIATSISNLEQSLAQNSYFLPSYELRASLKSISDLKETLENVNAKLIPKKKFSFRNKTTSKIDPAKLFNETVEKPNADVSVKEVKNTPGFRDKKGKVLVKDFRKMDGNGEFTLANLEECEVYLKGRIRALFVNRVRKCKVHCGPVFGSILIEDVEGCVFMLASHQIRIHEARVCDFYLRVRSRPIIEGCVNVRFAEYKFGYKGVEEDLVGSGLGEDMMSWENVVDFKWLRAVQSPNWCLIPEEERVEVVDGSNLEENCGDS